MELIVLSLNISCGTPWRAKSAALKKLVAETNPDIVCLQEVAQNFAYDHPRYHQEERIKELLEARSSYSMITHPYVPDGDRRAENCLHGPAIFVLSPDIKDVSFADILIHQREDRSYHNVAARLTIGGKILTIVNVHLSAEARHEEVKRTLDWIASTTEDGEPVIACGDFNPHNAKDSQKVDVDATMRVEFTDTWDDLRPDDTLETYFSLEWWQSHYPDSDTAISMSQKSKTHPTSALDYFFHKNIQAIGIEQITSFMPGLSDHAALLAHYKLSN